jgi:hypothetical protein
MGDAAKPEGKKYATFAEFYALYLTEHSNRISRRVHFAGQVLALAFVATFAATGDPLWLLCAVAADYGFAWIGHFFFERDRAYTLRQPLYSFMADWKMFWEMLTGRLPL